MIQNNSNKNDIIRSVFLSGILLIIGLGYVFIIPPFEAPDEPAHFLRSWSVAEKQWVLKDHPKQVAVFILEEMAKRHEIYNYPLLKDMSHATEKAFHRIPNFAFNSSLYPPVPFIFYAATIKIISTVKNSDKLTLIFYSCRIISLIIFIAALFFSFYRLGNLCWPLFWIACTPMAISQASVISIDGILFGSTAIMASIVLKPKGDADHIFLIISLLFLGLTKSTYLILAFFPLILAIADKKYRPVYFAGMLITLSGAIVWQIIMERKVVDFSLELLKMYALRDVDPQKQIGYIMTNPLVFMDILYKSIVHNISAHVQQFVGVLGWLNIYLPRWITIFWIIMAGYSVFCVTRPENMSKYFGILLSVWGIILALATCIAIFISLYLLWMPVESSSIEVQGRYFHAPAIIALLCLAIMTPGIKKFNDVSLYLLPLSAVLINMISFLTIKAAYGG